MGGNLPTIVTAIFVPVIIFLFSLLAKVVTEWVDYLREENRELKAERDGVMKTLVKIAETQEGSIVAIGEFVKELVGQQEYDRRREAERRHGGDA
jgi:hypothetical protein